MPVLSIKSLSYSYPDARGRLVHALDDVSLDVPNGEFLVVLGPSGCGKTTLLKLVAGFLPVQRGAIAVDGQPVAGPDVSRGVVFQGDALFPWLTVRDNVTFSQKLKKAPLALQEQTGERLLERVGLAGFGDRHIWELSGGMRQRVGLARALAADPSILLLDEPLGALDALTREDMQELILDIWGETGKTVFLITHSIEEALFMATRLIVMAPRPGRVVSSFTFDFGRRYLAGERSRALKSEPAFIAAREKIADLVYERRVA